jgi:CRISPR/Cas system-associated exonuclease Cas4 (RecB family)
MKIPSLPKARKLTSLSPSLYEAVLACKARAVWIAFGGKDAMPSRPEAILGSCFHDVIAAAHKGTLRRDNADIEEEARRLFDLKAQERFQKAHEAVRAKFRSKEHLPFYHLQRASAAALARKVSPEAGIESAVKRQGLEHRARLVEQFLQSKDEMLAGRADLIDVNGKVVVDYKTRQEVQGQPQEVTDKEKRQLRLYAYLASQNGISVERGVIALASGRELPVVLTEAEVKAEADAVRAALSRYNAAVGEQADFDELAQASPTNCQYCPCMVLCSRFWQTAKSSWEEQVGKHLSGRVVSTSCARLQGVELVTLKLDEVSSTFATGKEVILEQVPEHWMIYDAGAPLSEGSLIRVMNAQVAISTTEQTILRFDRARTEVWVMPPDRYQDGG